MAVKKLGTAVHLLYDVDGEQVLFLEEHAIVNGVTYMDPKHVRLIFIDGVFDEAALYGPIVDDKAELTGSSAYRRYGDDHEREYLMKPLSTAPDWLQSLVEQVRFDLIVQPLGGKSE